MKHRNFKIITLGLERFYIQIICLLFVGMLAHTLCATFIVFEISIAEKYHNEKEKKN